jgi:NhaP-type Na+/H+ or K+/H+ antiporter
MTTVTSHDPDYSQAAALTNFLKVGVLSIVLGIFVGGLVCFILKHMQFLSLNPVLETLYIMVGAYLSYALAHLPIFQLSGDVAIFFYGIMMSHYNKFNMNFETFKNIG